MDQTGKRTPSERNRRPRSRHRDRGRLYLSPIPGAKRTTSLERLQDECNQNSKNKLPEWFLKDRHKIDLQEDGLRFASPTHRAVHPTKGPDKGKSAVAFCVPVHEGKIALPPIEIRGGDPRPKTSPPASKSPVYGIESWLNPIKKAHEHITHRLGGLRSRTPVPYSCMREREETAMARHEEYLQSIKDRQTELTANRHNKVRRKQEMEQEWKQKLMRKIDEKMGKSLENNAKLKERKFKKIKAVEERRKRALERRYMRQQSLSESEAMTSPSTEQANQSELGYLEGRSGIEANKEHPECRRIKSGNDLADTKGCLAGNSSQSQRLLSKCYSPVDEEMLSDTNSSDDGDYD